MIIKVLLKEDIVKSSRDRKGAALFDMLTDTDLINYIILATEDLTIPTFTFSAPGKDFDSGLQATILVHAGWTVPQSSNSANPGFISVSNVDCTAATLNSISGSTIIINTTCSGGKSFTVTYAGNGTQVTAPATPGPYEFTTQTKQNGGVLTNITQGKHAHLTHHHSEPPPHHL